MNRPTILANLDRVLAHVKRTNPGRAAGQLGLFDTEAAALPPLEFAAKPDFSDDERLWFERKATGAFLSGHPVLARRAKAPARYTHRCRDRLAIEAIEGRTARIVVAGLVRRFESIGRIAFLTLEDETGPLDVLVFGDEAERFAFCLKVNAIIAVKLNVKHDPNRGPGLVLEQAAILGWLRNPEA